MAGKFAQMGAGMMPDSDTMEDAGDVAASDPQVSMATEETDLSRFYGDILPETGPYCVVRLPEGRQVFVSSIADLIAETARTPNHTGVYFGTADYKDDTSRKQGNVLGLKALRLDIDCGPEKYARDPDKVYATQEDGLTAQHAFDKLTGLQPTYVASSGAGLHVYYCLTEAVAPEVWKCLATLLKALCKALAHKADPSVTADTARILRALGSLHKNGKRVGILEHSGVKHDIAVLEAQLRECLADAGGESVPTPRRKSINDELLDTPAVLADNRNRDPGLIAAGCGMFNKFLQTGDPGGEESWRRCAGILQFCPGGAPLFHKASSKYPRYTYEEARDKWDGWTAGPPTCAGIAAQGWDCKSCPNRGRITSPVQLGDSLDTPKPDALAELRTQAASGALRTVVDQTGTVNYVKTYERAGLRCRDVYSAGTQAAEDLLMGSAMAAGGKIPSQQQMAAFEAQQRNHAKESGIVTLMALRVAEKGGAVHHDLGPGRIAVITAERWGVTDELDDMPFFRRGAGAGALPQPVFTGDAPRALRFLVGQYQTLFGLEPQRALVAVVLLLDALNPNTTHPVREYVGPGGSGKSTMAEHDINLIDPGDSGRRTTGIKGDDIAAAAQQQFCVSVDNSGRLDKSTQDTFCVMSTGGVLMVRQFHKQAEVMPLRMHCPVFITSVSPVCTAPDLMTRVVRFEMPARPKGSYVAEHEMRERMDAARPQMLGAIYTLLSAALRVMPQVRERKEWPHRMVSFDQLGEAVVLAAGLKPGAFLAVMGGMRERMARRTASGDHFVIHLLAALRKFAAQPTDSTRSSLSAILKRKVPISVLTYDGDRVEITARPNALRDIMPRPSSFDRDNAMPGSDRAFLDALRRVQPMLASMGIEYSERQLGTRPMVQFDTRMEALSAD